MRLLTRHILRAGFALVVTTLTTAAFAQTSFSATYKGGSTSSCGTTFNISGKEPTASGKYPVYIHIGGTGEPYNGAWASAAVDAMAAKGFVAATVEYDNGSFGTCTTISTRAKCIFNGANANSAIAKLCARAKADCSKGVVTGGLSQGSIISVLSRNFDSRIRASMGQGTGSTYTVAYNLESCMANGKHTQPGDRLRIINGERDMFVGGTESIARSQAELVTGLKCSGLSPTECFRSNGSGWAVVKDYQVNDLYADHCFMGLGTYGAQCTGILAVDTNYRYGSGAWALPATTNWLKSFVTP
ncbi:hypothetical protein [Piscinibacter gummiphilus]|uniref:Uncharacterized protein n=1 Tax=Piscinibacter gummiphilus TaxID=946333 RepID=A0ABZ0CX91_9BURK|nr:hypothetical protein [Piscinibacter gummiphilus]WOB09572.1 hypothetical protein RXV79_05790 [Piscinibacter gummiphilus]